MGLNAGLEVAGADTDDGSREQQQREVRRRRACREKATARDGGRRARRALPGVTGLRDILTI